MTNTAEDEKMTSNDLLISEDKYMMESVMQRKSWLDQFRTPNHYPTFDGFHKSIGYARKG